MKRTILTHPLRTAFLLLMTALLLPGVLQAKHHLYSLSMESTVESASEPVLIRSSQWIIRDSSESAAQIPLRAYCHRSVSPENIRVSLNGLPATLQVDSSGWPLLKMTLAIPYELSRDSSWQVKLQYLVRQPLSGKLILPVIFVDLAPLESRDETFTAHIKLPENTVGRLLFPAVAPENGRISLPVIPAWLDMALLPPGSSPFSFYLGVDLLVIGLLLIAALFLWKPFKSGRL